MACGRSGTWYSMCIASTTSKVTSGNGNACASPTSNGPSPKAGRAVRSMPGGEIAPTRGRGGHGARSSARYRPLPQPTSSTASSPCKPREVERAVLEVEPGPLVRVDRLARREVAVVAVLLLDVLATGAERAAHSRQVSCSSSFFERVVLGEVEREAQLRHEHAARLHEHRLLAGRQPLRRLAQREVPDHLGDLVHVAALQLLLVVLEPPAPVGGLAYVLLAEQLEEVVDVLGGDRRAHADFLGLVGGHRERHLAVRDLQDEVLALLAPDLEGLLPIDDRSTVVRVDDAVADFEGHATPRLTALGSRSCTKQDRSLYQGKPVSPVRLRSPLPPCVSPRSTASRPARSSPGCTRPLRSRTARHLRT